MHKWPVHLWSTRAKLAVTMRIASYSLLQRIIHFSDCTAVVYQGKRI
jgi:hypothetical protein